MPGDTGWTVVTLRKYIEVQLADIRRSGEERYRLAREAIQTQLDAADKAVTKAEAANERRFESVNEFRGQLNDQAATFISRTEYDVAHSALSDKLDGLDRRLSEQLNALTSRLDLNQGQDSGVAALQRRVALGAGTLIALIGVAIAAAAFLSR